MDRCAPRRCVAVVLVQSAELIAGLGIKGNHATGKAGGGKWQVTLIQQEYLSLIACFAGVAAVRLELLRRNIVVSVINLLALKRRHFRLGNAVLEGISDCHPCRLMEELLGRGGFNAMCGHGGLTEVMCHGGRIAVGNPLTTDT